MNRIPRSLGFCLAAVAAAAIGLRAFIASEAWFKTDDFYFLHLVRSASWRWSEVFLPSHPRSVAIAYRPIGLDGYFFANYSAFGWNAFGYYVTGFLLQLATATVVYRIARQERFERPFAWVAAAISLIGGPSLTATYAVAEHNYLCVGLFYALCVSIFLDHLREPRRWRLVGCCVLLLLALWSNDVALTVAPLLALLAFARTPAPGWRARARTACLRTWPVFAVTVVFLDFRIYGVPWQQNTWFYEIDVGVDMVWNALGNLAHASGGELRFVLLLTLTTAALSVLRREGRSASWLGPAWLGLASLPFAVLAFPTSRFALALLPPLALCLGAVASVLVAKVGDPRQRTAALAALVALCVPWEEGLSLATHPRWQQQRQAYELARRTLPFDDRSCLTILCGPGLANMAECSELRELTFGGELFRAVVPHRYIFVEFEDRRLEYAAFAGEDCTTYELRADGRLASHERAERPASTEELSQLR